MESFAIETLFTEDALVANGLSPASLGTAYLILIASTVLTVAVFIAARLFLVVTPNRHARHYGLYVTMVLVALMIAAALEIRLVAWQSTAIGYALFPQLALVAAIHFRIYHDRQPWLITLGAAAVIGSIATMIPFALFTATLQPVHWVAVALLAGLLAWLARHAVATKQGFVRARSIHVESQETKPQAARPQRPWLGLPQWVSLAIASAALTMFNATLQGSGIANVPAMAVLVQSLIVLAITAGVCAIPAGTYWLAHRHWMPELNRFVWLVWLVVGFAFSYGNYLSHLNPL